MADYIKWLRSKVGHETVFLNFSVGIIRNKEGKFLMNRRGDSNLWGFIGGCMELGEDFEETLRREIYEETGLKQLLNIEKFGTYTWSDFVYPNGDQAQPIEHWFVCDAGAEVDLTYTDEETLELRWIDLAHLDVTLFNKNHLKVIEDYNNNYVHKKII